MRTFKVIRMKEKGSKYEVGHILDGVEFEDGLVVIRWRSEMASTAVYKNYDDFSKIHIEDHPEYNSEVIWNEQVDLNEMIAKKSIEAIITNIKENIKSCNKNEQKNLEKDDISMYNYYAGRGTAFDELREALEDLCRKKE